MVKPVFSVRVGGYRGIGGSEITIGQYGAAKDGKVYVMIDDFKSAISNDIVLDQNHLKLLRKTLDEVIIDDPVKEQGELIARQIDLQDGKYTIIDHGDRFEVLRYGEPWPASNPVNNLEYAMAAKLFELMFSDVEKTNADVS